MAAVFRAWRKPHGPSVFNSIHLRSIMHEFTVLLVFGLISLVYVGIFMYAEKRYMKDQ